MPEDDNKNNNNLIILTLGIVGITLGFFAYLIYTQNKEKHQLQLSKMSYKQPIMLHDQLTISYEPQIISMLKNQEYMINNQQDQINKISDLNRKLIDNVNINQNNSKSTNIDTNLLVNNNKQKNVDILAGSILNSKCNVQDKIRQSKFGLL